MKNKLKHLAFAAVALASFVPSGMAQTNALLTYNSGDLFLGFRRVGTNAAANNLAVNLGSGAQFLPTSLGGLNAPGSSFLVQFGVVPGTTNAVFDLNTDLTTVFGASWASNPTNGSGVRWAVVGFTDDSVNNTPISGLNARSAFLTRARTNPATQSTPLVYASTSHLDPFAAEFKNFAYGTGGGAFASSLSTTNSSEALINSAGLTNSWNTRIGSAANGSFGLGSARRVEQPQIGNFTGPTDSVLDLYLAPFTGSSLVSDTTYLGNFSLDSSGELTFTSVPEPSTYALLGLTAAAGFAWRMRLRRLRGGRIDG
ncbi:MAG: PEP-CTERM sorting domain-containing protein [Chthoniobacterales bacterium]